MKVVLAVHCSGRIFLIRDITSIQVAESNYIVVLGIIDSESGIIDTENPNGKLVVYKDRYGESNVYTNQEEMDKKVNYHIRQIINKSK